MEPKRDVRQRTLDGACEEDRRQRQYELLTRVERARRWGRSLEWASTLLAGASWAGLFWVCIHQFEPGMLETWAPLVVLGWVVALGLAFSGERRSLAVGRLLGLTSSAPHGEEIDHAIRELRHSAGSVR